jgi:hypothetical protein
MICHTCSCITVALGYCDGGTWRHCPRCGTVRHLDTVSRGEQEPTVIVPELVQRCRDYESVANEPVDGMLWRKLGIAECIQKPEERT